MLSGSAQQTGLLPLEGLLRVVDGLAAHRMNVLHVRVGDRDTMAPENVAK